MKNIDTVNKNILDILQENGSITNAELANQIGLAPATTLERVRKLENSGVISKRVALLNHKKVGKDTTAFIAISMAEHSTNALRRFNIEIQQMPEVLECYHIAGEEDYLLKVVVDNMQQYEKFLVQRLSEMSNLGKIRTLFVLSTVKYQTKIPLNGKLDHKISKPE